MSEHREEHLDLCAAYALGSLDEADRKRLDEHLAGGCRVCEAALGDFSAATVLLAASTPPVRPPAALRERVLAAVAAAGAPDLAEAPKPTDARGRVVALKPRRPSPWVWTWAAAAAALAVTSALLWNEASQLRARIETSNRQLGELTSRLSEQQRLNEVLSAPGARVAVLELTPAGAQALRARATYDPTTRNAVVVFENFTPPSGHDYELWAIRGASPASLGVIQVDEAGRAVVRLENVGDPTTLNAFAVSLEPKGGSPNPTAPSGPVVMLGKLGG